MENKTGAETETEETKGEDFLKIKNSAMYYTYIASKKATSQLANNTNTRTSY